MKNILFIIFLLFLLFLSSCKEESIPPPQESVLNLKLEDVSCTEAWITLTTTNLQLPTTLDLLKDDNIIKTINLEAPDTLLYIDSLLPNQTYNFQISGIGNPASGIKSNVLLATTLDTTSHNFTFETFEFGQHSSSALYDVAVIDENNIWAVGEIYMKDSLGQPDHNAYNAVRWDGNGWSIKKISVLYNGNLITPPLYGIFALSANEIWLSSGVPIKGDGTNWQQYHLFDMGVLTQQDGYLTKIWCSSSTDIYFVGTLGTIAHYNGSSWKKIESGTPTNIKDAWGIIQNGVSTVFCPVSSIFNPPQDKKILKIVDGKVDSVGWERDVRINSAWTKNENFLYVCGEGVFVNKFGSWEEIRLPLVGTNSIRGNDLNDIFIDGDSGFISHFNGITWKVFDNNYLKGYSRLSFKGNIVAIAGNYQGKAIMEIGRRN